jgi:hypothetical protein
MTIDEELKQTPRLLYTASYHGTTLDGIQIPKSHCDLVLTASGREQIYAER